MHYQLTENQEWALLLISIVYLPMVATKVGRYPLTQIINQFPVGERENIRRGIDALIEMSILVRVGRDICITENSEKLYKALYQINGQPTDDVKEMLSTRPGFSYVLTTINNDDRFRPITETSLNAQLIENTISSAQTPETASAGIVGQIISIIVLAFITLGLINAIFD